MTLKIDELAETDDVPERNRELPTEAEMKARKCPHPDCGNIPTRANFISDYCETHFKQRINELWPPRKPAPSL